MSDYECDEDLDEVGNASLNGTTMKPYQHQTECTGEQMVVRQAEHERAEMGAAEMKVTMPGKIVSYKYCLASSNVSMKRDFYTDVLFS